jgi:hypothetical protein
MSLVKGVIMYFQRDNTEKCLCITSGDTIGLVASNLNCDNSRVRNLAGSTVAWAVKNEITGLGISGGFVQATDVDFVSVVLSAAQTAGLGGVYQYQIRVTDASGNVTTLNCGCGCLVVNKSII